MRDINNNREFLSYIKTPLSKNSLDVLYSANGIKFERCKLFSDFVESLIIIVTDTYMGDDITKPDQRLQHFHWCWEKNVENFSKENIHFRHHQNLYEYFQEFMLDVYYSSDKGESEYLKHNLIKLWKYVFNYNTNKTRSDVDTFIEVYKMFEKSLNI